MNLKLNSMAEVHAGHSAFEAPPARPTDHIVPCLVFAHPSQPLQCLLMLLAYSVTSGTFMGHRKIEFTAIQAVWPNLVHRAQFEDVVSTHEHLVTIPSAAKPQFAVAPNERKHD